MKIITYLILFFTLLATAPLCPAQASEDIATAFCDELKGEKEKLYETYERHNLKSYQILVQGYKNWIFRSKSDFKTNFSISLKTISYFKALEEAFKKKNVTLITLYTPPRGVLHADQIPQKIAMQYDFDPSKAWESYSQTLKALQNSGIHIVPFERSELPTSFFYKRDHHWAPDGAKYVAQKIATLLKAFPTYQGLDKTEFKTKSLGSQNFKGTFKKVFKNICKTKIPPEHVEKFETALSDTVASEKALFEEAAIPKIVLIGTSNSATHPNIANFDGFLKEALSSDILNVSINGAGIDGPILAYLNSKEFKETPPKFVIWEIPGYYSLNAMESRIFRQAIPAIYGSCNNTALQHTEKEDLKEGTLFLFEDLVPSNIEGSAYYIHLGFSQKIQSPVTIKLLYKNSHDRYTIKRPKRFPHDGEFYLALKDNNKGLLHSVEIELSEEPFDLFLTARICKRP